MADDNTSTTSTPRRSSRASRKPMIGQSSTPVLSAEYLNRHSSKNDLVNRLSEVNKELQDDNVEPNSPDYPGLAGLAAVLVENRYLKHKDKEVRLLTVLACMEIFAKYAPEPPWDETEILVIFPQLIQQLANLSNCTSPKQKYFEYYYALLEHLALIKTGVVLIEATKTLDHGRSSDDADEASNVGLPTSEDALGILCELIGTLLNSVSIDHPSEISKYVVEMVVGCLEEFDVIPIPVLDEILICIGHGPVINVTNPEFVKESARIANAKKKGKRVQPGKLPPMHIQQTNQSYVVAERVISRTLDRISSPIANLLNGLLNGDTNIIKHSDIPSDLPMQHEKTSSTMTDCIPEPEENIIDVWTIIFELHKVSPQILITVIGTVANSLTHHTEEKRIRVTNLLGSLFCSRETSIATDFHPCYRAWIKSSFDKSMNVRHDMVGYLIAILREKPTFINICEEATKALVSMTMTDTSYDIRSLCINQICDVVYRYGGEDKRGSTMKYSAPFIAPELIYAVGDRVKSKTKKERLEAITGLSKIYKKHYMWEKIESIQQGGDDCGIDIIVDAMRNNCEFNMYIDDTDEPKKRKRKQANAGTNGLLNSVDERYKSIPKLVFECFSISDSIDPALRSRIMVIVDDVLLGDASASRRMTPTSRAVGLTMIVNYLQTLNDKDGCKLRLLLCLMAVRKKLQMSVRSYTDARAKAESCEPGSIEREEANAIAFQKLEAVATQIPPPAYTKPTGKSPEDIQTVLNKLHNAKDKHIFRLLASISSPSHSTKARLRASTELPNRTESLGPSTSSWVKTLASRCAMGNFFNAEITTHCVQLAQECFNEGDFDVCRAFLESSFCALRIFPSLATKEMSDMLVEFFGECRESHHRDDQKQINQLGIVTMLSSILALISSNRASPTKGKKDASTASDESLLNEKMQTELYNLCINGTFEQSRNAVLTLAGQFESGSPEQVEAFSPILKTLTSATRLTLTTNGLPYKKIVNVISTLTAIIECVPAIFVAKGGKDDKGGKAVRFILNSVLLGRGDESSSEYHSDSGHSFDEDDDVLKGDNKEKKHHPKADKTSPKRKKKETPELSLSCMRICSAISFLATHIRKMVLHSRATKTPSPSPGYIGNVFDLLVTILKEGGQPPSSRDQKECRHPEEKSALRECATLNLLRLCDGNLQLEAKYLTPGMWHILSRGVIDRDAAVRDVVMRELSSMLKGEDIYRCRALPSLRFLSFIVLCPDCDVTSHLQVNGGAGNVGRSSTIAKDAAVDCIIKLRKTCENTRLHCLAMSREADFERKIKLMMMPEFTVPFAFHLLSLRPETPSGGLNGQNINGSTDEWTEADDDARYKMLHKRLKWLYDPLVQSLGDGADNISFLLRQCELMGKSYKPVGIAFSKTGMVDESNEDLARSRLQVITSTAREILLKYIKKDVNLKSYPGTIQIPADLFKKVTTHSNSPRKHRTGPEDDIVDLEIDITNESADIQNDDLKINLSPIPQSRTPDSDSPRVGNVKLPSDESIVNRLFPSPTEKKQDSSAKMMNELVNDDAGESLQLSPKMKSLGDNKRTGNVSNAVIQSDVGQNRDPIKENQVASEDVSSPKRKRSDKGTEKNTLENNEELELSPTRGRSSKRRKSHDGPKDKTTQSDSDNSASPNDDDKQLEPSKDYPSTSRRKSKRKNSNDKSKGQTTKNSKDDFDFSDHKTDPSSGLQKINKKTSPKRTKPKKTLIKMGKSPKLAKSKKKTLIKNAETRKKSTFSPTSADLASQTNQKGKTTRNTKGRKSAHSSSDSSLQKSPEATKPRRMKKPRSTSSSTAAVESPTVEVRRSNRRRTRG